MQGIKRFDYHTGVSKEFLVKTTQGALLSVFTILFIFYLILTEVNYNLTPSLRDRVHVNATSPSGVEMEFDITFPNVACALLSIDANDPAGQSQSLHIDRTHRIFKHRLNKDGLVIGGKSHFEQGRTLQSLVTETDFKYKPSYEEENEEEYDQDEEYCGSCYGAGDDGECCNTCDDVKRAYQRKGWLFNALSDIKQCAHTRKSKEEKGEGCNIHGIVALSSGGGNIHIAPGHDLENFGSDTLFESLEDLINQVFDTFNVSHTINKLRFGRDYPGDLHQLDGVSRNVEDVYAMYQYYVQIVPTLYKFLNGTEIQTNQYSVIEHVRHVTPQSNRGLPGVFFFYEVSALHVEIEEYRRGWTHFFTSVAAVVGGVFSAMSIADSYLFNKSFKNAPRLG